MFTIVERKSVKGKPTWYLHGPTGYIGALFFPDADVREKFRTVLVEDADSTYHAGIAFHDGPGFHQSAKAS